MHGSFISPGSQEHIDGRRVSLYTSMIYCSTFHNISLNSTSVTEVKISSTMTEEYFFFHIFQIKNGFLFFHSRHRPWPLQFHILPKVEIKHIGRPRMRPGFTEVPPNLTTAKKVKTDNTVNPWITDLNSRSLLTCGFFSINTVL